MFEKRKEKINARQLEKIDRNTKIEGVKLKKVEKYDKVESKLLVETKAMAEKKRDKFDPKAEKGKDAITFGGKLHMAAPSVR